MGCNFYEIPCTSRYDRPDSRAAPGGPLGGHQPRPLRYHPDYVCNQPSQEPWHQVGYNSGIGLSNVNGQDFGAHEKLIIRRNAKFSQTKIILIKVEAYGYGDIDTKNGFLRLILYLEIHKSKVPMILEFPMSPFFLVKIRKMRDRRTF